MCEAKFTKGGWHAKPNEKDETAIQVFYPHGFLTSSGVIKVDDTKLAGESWIDMRERTKPLRESARIESNANMHLIATAPEMYEMLEYVMKCAAMQDNLTIDANEISKLLAKARGEHV